MDSNFWVLALFSVSLMFLSVKGSSKCGDPPSIENGYAREMRFGLLAQYFCNPGFRVFGQRLISCTPQRTWKGKVPVCVASTCDYLPPPLHATTIELMGGAAFEYKCREGYKMEGVSVIHCNGHRWSAPPPLCTGTGPDLITPTPAISTTSFSPPMYPPENAIEDPGNVTTGITESDTAHNVNTMRKPIFVGHSERPPVFHSNYMNNMGSDGVLPLYRVPGTEDTEDRNTFTRDVPPRDWQMPPNSRRPPLQPIPPIRYSPYYRPSYNNYMATYPQYNRFPQAGYMPPRRPPIYQSSRIVTGNAMRSISLARDDGPSRIPASVETGRTGVSPDAGTRDHQSIRYGNSWAGSVASSPRYPPLVQSRDDRVKNEPTVGDDSVGAGSNQNVKEPVVAGVLQTPQSEKVPEDDSPEHARSCPLPRRPLQGYYTTRPLPRDYEGDEYQYLVQYHCLPGLTMVGGSNISYCTTKGKWTGALPRCQKIEKCEAGYKLLSSGRCADVNECAVGNGGCRYKCINFPGGFRCSCFDGFRDNGSGCIDLDECNDEDENFCEHICHNTMGSFRCTCRAGYLLRPGSDRNCVDVNECIENSPCDHLCQNTLGSYRCACRANFRLDEDGKTCYEVCQPGYIMELDAESNTKTCADEDECAEHGGLGNCGQVCNNTEGSYFCSCFRGYKLNEDGQTCSDLNECDDSPCAYGCINTEGSYTCSCPEHQVLSEDGLSCIGCLENLYMNNGKCIPCPLNSITEEIGAQSIARCICRPGFGGNPQLEIPCTDVNECEDDNYGCSHTCVNTPGSVFCDCPPGYTLDLDGRNCRDIDECSDRFGVCGGGGRCQNTDGGYNCTCANGFQNGATQACVDVNECTINNGGCQARCHNLQPGHRCSCNRNWRLGPDGRSCIPIQGPCSPLAPLPNGRVLPDVPCVRMDTVVKGRVCFYACNSGYKLVGRNRVQCDNTGWSSEPPQCVAQSQCSPVEVGEGVRVIPPSCAQNSSMPWRMCVFSCEDSSQMLKGSRVTRCIPTRGWERRPPVCLSRQTTVIGSSVLPRIKCPRDMDVELGPGQSSAELTLPRPVSNMEVTEQRNDGSPSRNIFPAGVTSVKFTANTEDGHRQASCVMRVFVRDREAPTIQRCPGSITIDSPHKYPEIHLQRPLFSDNVNVTGTRESRHPPGNLTWGTYSITHTASDAAGNMAECAYTITIRRPKMSRKQGVEACGQPDGPANGNANCNAWARGVYCVPRCDPGFAFDRSPPTYVCDNEGTWTPGRTIPDCMDMRLGKARYVSTSTTTPEMSTNSTTLATQTSLPNSTAASDPTASVSRVRILERPNFYKVPLQTVPTPVRGRKRPPVLHAPDHFIRSRVSQPRLIKLLPETTDCPQGHVPEIDDVGLTTCVECPKGYYRPRIASAVRCLPCSPGFYQDRPGKGYCNRCPNHVPGTLSPSESENEDLKSLISVEQCVRLESVARRSERDAHVREAITRRRRRLLRLKHR